MLYQISNLELKQNGKIVYIHIGGETKIFFFSYFSSKY